MRRLGQAFTLLEVLVAVTLTGLVLALTYGVLASTLDTQEVARQAVRTADRQTAFLDVLAVDLEGAVLATPANRQPTDSSWLVEMDSGGLRAFEFPTQRGLFSFSEPAELGPIRVRYELSGTGTDPGSRNLVRIVYAEGRILSPRLVVGGLRSLEIRTPAGKQWRAVRSATLLKQAPPALRVVATWATSPHQTAARTFVLGGPVP